MSRSYVQHLLYTAVVFSYFFITTTSTSPESPPIIIKEPLVGEIPFIIGINNSFQLDCEAEGNPFPKYRWTKNGEPFNMLKLDVKFNQGTLNFTEATHEDEGHYQCFAYNPFGTATSKSVNVVEIKNYFIEYNNNITVVHEVIEGEPFNIQCNPLPNGRYKPKFDWIVDETGSSASDNRTTVDPNGMLWFSYVMLNDSNYTYQFSYSSLNDEHFLRCPTKLNVTRQGNPGLTNSSPKIQYVTEDTEVLLGGEAELFCIYSGNPVPGTNWFKNGLIIQYNKYVETKNYGKSLLIRNVTAEDTGNYTCNVDNGVDPAQSNHIKLDVMVVPYFIESPKIVENLTGETAVIKCLASGHPNPTIEWTHNGRPLTEAQRNSSRLTITPDSITITSLTESDIGNYGCNATNRVGYVYKDVYINIVNSSLNFPEYVATNGTSVTIGCKLFGTPLPHIKWTKNNIELIGERYAQLGNGALLISQVDFDDTGNYTCSVTDDYDGQNESILKQLYVKEPTQFTTEPINQNDLIASITESGWLIGVLAISMVVLILGTAVCTVNHNRKEANNTEELEIVRDPTSSTE